ncbi:MAG: DNA-binding PadR family transcriptional regulator [Roseivirga sp.]|jgi:DNA-binding PadR family transcriptional regulator
MGGASQERGGRRKRMYILTGSGRAILDQVRLQRENLYNQLPNGISYSFAS